MWARLTDWLEAGFWWVAIAVARFLYWLDQGEDL